MICSPVECPPLSLVDHATVKSVTEVFKSEDTSLFGDVVTYQCDSGYEPDTPSMKTRCLVSVTTVEPGFFRHLKGDK